MAILLGVFAFILYFVWDVFDQMEKDELETRIKKLEVKE